MEIALMNVWVLPFIAGYPVRVNAPLWWKWPLGATVGLYTALALLSLLLIRALQRRPASAGGPPESAE